MERIESASNAKIKLAASLHQRKERERRGEFVAEGVRLAETAALSGWPLSFCIVAEPALANERVQGILGILRKQVCPVYVVPPNVYKKASATESPQGILLVMKTVQSFLSKLDAGNDALFVVLDRIQDPGNAGTIIRTADAAGCSGVIAMEGTVDLFSDKVVRSSMGSLFHLPVVPNVKGSEWMTFAKKHGISWTKRRRLISLRISVKRPPSFSGTRETAFPAIFWTEPSLSISRWMARRSP